MKRYNTPLLGSNYGATIRLLGPHVPQPVLHPLEELEPVPNPFLPPGTAPMETRTKLPLLGTTQRIEQEFDERRFDDPRVQRERESDTWSNDTPSRLLPKVPASGRMVFGSFLIFAVLGAGGFAALYSAVHSDDAEIREQNAAEEAQEARGAAVANAAPLIPAVPVEPAAPVLAMPPTSAAPSAGANAVGASAAPSDGAKNLSAASHVDSGAQPPGASAAVQPSEPRRLAVAAPAPAKFDAVPAPPKAPVVVHVEPAPVVPPYMATSRRMTPDKDVPVSEDAVVGSGRPVQPSPDSHDESSQAAPRAAEPSTPPPGNGENPDDSQK